MRVAMLGQYPPDEKRIVGGVEAVMVPLLRGLRRFDDLEVHVVTSLGGVREHERTTASGWPLHVVGRKRLGRITFHVRDVAALQSALRRIQPDVVHAQGMGIYAAAAVGSCHPHVVTTHGIFFREAEWSTGLGGWARGYLDSQYEKRCLRRVENLISISPYVEEELRVIGGFRGRAFRIENPVDDCFFEVSDTPEQAMAQRDSVLLFAGRVIPRKGLLVLLRALATVRRAVPQVSLWVAGETTSAPDYVAACRELIAELGLSTAVKFLGSLTMDEMAAQYARSTIVVLPSKQETAPVVVAEAMAAGRPVVATRVCGVPYMVEDGVSGLMVDYGDAESLAAALVRLLSDEPLCARMGRRGRELAEARFRLDVVARQTRQVYLELCAQGAIHPKD